MSAKVSLSFPLAPSHNLQQRRSGRRAHDRYLSILPTDVPIPPSLLQSPYLHSPQSIFRHAAVTLRNPSKEDDEWLRDTVPVWSTSQGENNRTSVTGSSHRLRMQSLPNLKQEAVALQDTDVHNVHADVQNAAARTISYSSAGAIETKSARSPDGPANAFLDLDLPGSHLQKFSSSSGI